MLYVLCNICLLIIHILVTEAMGNTVTVLGQAPARSQLNCYTAFCTRSCGSAHKCVVCSTCPNAPCMRVALELLSPLDGVEDHLL